MRISLIDVDGHNMPNLPLMKLSAWHKAKGDAVEWYDPLTAWIDPPYVLGSRAGKQYKHEMTDADHEDLLKLLLQSKAKVMISGYESDMYNDYLADWKKKQFSSCAEHGKPRTETVWMNYRADLQMNFLDFPEWLPDSPGLPNP